MFYEKKNESGYIANETPFDVLYRESVEESANYIKTFLNEAIICDEGWWNIALDNINNEGLCLEFGVYTATSLNYFSNKLKNRIWYGFDSFYGLQENWRGGWFAKNHFTLNGKKPKVNENIILIKGWFKDTLPIFLENNKEKISFIHIDCDTYESTKDVLNNIEFDRFINNSIILFDEYMGYINWKNHEFKAWQEYVKNNNVNYKYIAFGNRQAVIKIIK
jgi:hypothetical protein